VNTRSVLAVLEHRVPNSTINDSNATAMLQSSRLFKAKNIKQTIEVFNIKTISVTSTIIFFETSTAVKQRFWLTLQ